MASELSRALDSWDDLNHSLSKLSLAEAYELLDLEFYALRRRSYVQRIIQYIIGQEANERRKQLEAKYL